MTNPLVTNPPVATGGFAPWSEWPEVHKFVNQTWDPENNPHHSIIAGTGGGKSFLAINGILRPMCRDDRVLIIDCKRNDKLVASAGKPVTEIPPKTWPTRKREPFDMWFRLCVHDQFTTEGRAKAKLQVYHAMHRVYNEGDWVVYFDEIQDVGGIRQPNLGLGMHIDEMYRKGRSRHVSILASTQAPRFVPGSFYDQASWAWIGRLADEDRRKRMREIGGMPKEALPIVGELQKRHFLLAANDGENFLRTQVKVSDT